MEEFFKWKESFNIGVVEIDLQHRCFLECLNDCHEYLSRKKRTAVDRDLISRLREYVTTHFHYEEELMRSKRYPEIEQHEKQHRYFESQVAELEAGPAQGGRTPQSVLTFLRDWFLNHILEQDHKIVRSRPKGL